MVEEISKKHLSQLLDGGESNYKAALKQGRIDGSAGLPDPSSKEASEWEKNYLDNRKTAWETYLSFMKKERERGLSEIQVMNDDLERTTNRTEESIGVRQKRALDLLDSEMGESSLTYRRLRAAYDEKRDIAADLQQVLGRPLHVSLVKGYMPLMIVLALAEVQVNRLAFELFFESMPAISLLLAAAVGALLMFFAHIVGKQFKHSTCPVTVKDKTGIYLGIAGILFVCVLLMYFLGVMREELVRVQNASNINLEDLNLDDLTSGSTSNAGFSLALGTAGLFLLLLNFVIFLTGVVGSYFRHDSHPHYEKIVSECDETRKAFERHQSVFEKKQIELLRDFSSELSKSDAELKIREEQINAMARKRSRLDSELNSSRDSLILEMVRCLKAYRTENMAYRAGKPAPDYFKDNPLSLAQEVVRT